ncbi:hypothetical protein HQ576_02410 [bacterium]|nr:hypothetical protein [bacterium]
MGRPDTRVARGGPFSGSSLSVSIGVHLWFHLLNFGARKVAIRRIVNDF